MLGTEGNIDIGDVIVVVSAARPTANRVSAGSGGGIHDLSPAAKVFNTVVAGNFKGAAPNTTPGDIAGTLDASSAFNLIGTGGSGGLSNAVNGNEVGVTNPGLGSLANNGGPTQTVALLAGSTAIAQGSTAYVTAGETDQRGLPRVANGTVDIGAFEVQMLVANSFRVAGFPSPTMAGAAGSVTVTALDINGNPATGYTGTVHFTSSDGQALLPADYTFVSSDNGVHTFNITLKTAGSQSITATDTVSSTMTGSQTGITVNPAGAVTLTVISFPSPVAAGTAGSFTVTARDAYGNPASGYTGTVTFSSSDGPAALPANYTFTSSDAGSHSFSATLKTVGSQSITATDTASSTITGSQTGITVNPGAILTVNTLADETAADNFLSLREAVAVVDAGSTSGLSPAELAQITGTLGSTATIQFDPSLAGGTITLTGSRPRLPFCWPLWGCIAACGGSCF